MPHQIPLFKFIKVNNNQSTLYKIVKLKNCKKYADLGINKSSRSILLLSLLPFLKDRGYETFESRNYSSRKTKIESHPPSTNLSPRLDYLSFSRFDNPKVEQGIPPSSSLHSCSIHPSFRARMIEGKHLSAKIRTHPSCATREKDRNRGTKKQKIGRLSKLPSKGLWDICGGGGESSRVALTAAVVGRGFSRTVIM